MGDLVGGRFPIPVGEPPERIRVRMLGTLRVAVDGRPVDLGSPKQRCLLAILLLHRGDVVSTDRIIDMLWGEHPPRTAEHSVQLYISNLRRALGAHGPVVIVTRKPGYFVDLPAEALDVVRFERLADEGRRCVTEMSPSAADLLTAALELWQGEPFADTPLETVAQPEVRRWQDLRLRVLDDLAEAWLTSGDPARAVSWAQRACREDPYRERSRELFMLALYRAGRHREALRTYTVYRENLRNELGLDPTPSLASLQERILLHDPTLDPDRAAAAVPGPHRNPYKGLRPFDVSDSEDYFGREALTEQILSRLGHGHPLVAVVGPSGSGKSSVLAAGVLARVLSNQEQLTTVVEIAPDLHDPDEIESRVAAAHAGVEARPHMSAGLPVLVVMDQFEDHLLAVDEADARVLLDRVARVSGQPGVSVLLALRADLYDRPLRHPGFAETFASGVVNVLPMTATEVEAAVVAPASRVGVAVEPALLAELVAATADQPAQLPLLQFALTELFDRNPAALDLAGYQAIGGLQAALTRRAEQIRRGWSDDVSTAAQQIFLRLVRIEGGQIVRRRTPARELGSLTGVDPAAVSEVLGDVGRHHLVTFDRDEHTGHATVEVAHEALFEQWHWLANLVRKHRTALERHGALRTALEEWQAAADQDAAYLLRGSRLEQFQTWRAEGVLRLTEAETGFLDASQALADDEIAHETAMAETRRRLERRSRRWLLTAVAALLVGGVGFAFAVLAPGEEHTSRVGWVYHRTGYLDRFLEAGLDRAADENRFTLVKVDTDAATAASVADRFAAQGEDLVLVTTNDTDVAPVARQHRDVDFLTLTGVVDEPNVTSIGFAHQDGAFLIGAAAALASKTGTVGFIGGADTEVLRRFEAGFAAGARAITPDARVLSAYLSRVPDYDGFFDQLGARRTTRDMVRAGADVIFPAAGGAQYGALEEVAELSDQLGRQIWGIGVDDDAYLHGDWVTNAHGPEHVLTSMLIRYDVAAYDGLHAWLDGSLSPGLREYDLSNGGIELTQSGGFLTPYAARLEELRREVISGRIDVPCVPKGLAGSPAVKAAAGPGCP